MRKCKDWLTSYLKFTEKQESPDLFHLWCAISVVATCLGRKVWIDRGFYTLRPNLYIILVAESALCRKTTAIDLSSALIREAVPDIHLIAQKITPEAFINALKQYYSEHKVSEGYIIAEELSVFLGNSVSNSALVQLLTKVYGSQEVCDYHTLARGKEKCYNLYINLLGGTAPEWIRSSLPAEAIAGGFTGRIIFVHASKGRKDACPEMTDALRKLRQELMSDLRVIRELNGEAFFAKEAKDWFINWYEENYNPDEADFSLRGYYARKHDTLLKVALIISASRSDSLEIEVEDLKVALRVIEANEKPLVDVMHRISSTTVGDNLHKIKSKIKKAGKRGVRFSELLRAFSYCMDSPTVRSTLDVLLISEEIIGKKVGRSEVYWTAE